MVNILKILRIIYNIHSNEGFEMTESGRNLSTPLEPKTATTASVKICIHSLDLVDDTSQNETDNTSKSQSVNISIKLSMF